MLTINYKKKYYVIFSISKGFLLNIRYLKSLIAIVENGSIADAARMENLTAAAIGQRIQSLESELGMTLLSRVGHTAQPTQACMKLLPRIRKIVRDVELLYLSTDETGLGGIFRIGAISTVLTGILPLVLRELTQVAPKCQPVIVPGTSKELFHMLQDGKIDIAVLVAPPFELPSSLTAITLRNEPLIVLAPLNAVSDPIQLLNTQPYIRYAKDSWGGRHASAWLTQQTIKTKLLCDLDALETIGMLVSDKMGVSLIPQWAGMKRFTSGCQIIPIEDKSYKRSIILVSNTVPDLPQMNSLLKDILLSVIEIE